jgi:hypothetical protein
LSRYHIRSGVLVASTLVVVPVDNDSSVLES